MVAETIAADLFAEEAGIALTAEFGGAAAAETVAGGVLAGEVAGGVASELVGSGLAGEAAGSVAQSFGGDVVAGAAETIGAGPGVAAEAVDTQTKALADQILNGAPELDTTGSMAANGGTGAAPVAKAPVAKTGLVDGAMKWAEKNPVMATMAGTTVAGAVGGMGKAALEKEIAQRNIKARSDLMTQQYAQAQEQSRAGTMKGTVGVSPSGQKVLLRPDGTPVFAPGGLVNNQLA